MSTQTHIFTHTHAYTCVRTILHSYMHMHMYQCATAVQQQALTRILSEIISKLSTWPQAWRLLNTRWFSLQKWSLKPLPSGVRKEVSCSVYVVKSSDVYTSSQCHYMYKLDDSLTNVQEICQEYVCPRQPVSCPSCLMSARVKKRGMASRESGVTPWVMAHIRLSHDTHLTSHI